MEVSNKRKFEEQSLSIKKTKNEIEKRNSSLPFPSMILEGHKSEIFSLKFNPFGTVLATGSHDKTICFYFFLTHSTLEWSRFHKFWGVKRT